MGIWSDEIIGCDSTLELAMTMLTTCGIGPENYTERAKTFSVIMSHTPVEPVIATPCTVKTLSAFSYFEQGTVDRSCVVLC